jgi:hypothetical protein
MSQTRTKSGVSVTRASGLRLDGGAHGQVIEIRDTSVTVGTEHVILPKIREPLIALDSAA